MVHKGVLSKVIIFAFGIAALILNPADKVCAQSVNDLPVPGSQVYMSAGYNPILLKAVKVNADHPFEFEFIVDRGDTEFTSAEFKVQARKLIRYFLASLTIPENDLWVNLSPYEKDRIIPPSFGVTEMGRDLLSQDYILKQISATLVYPEGEYGKRFWDQVRAQAREMLGIENLQTNIFSKVWVVPEKAVVYENGPYAFVGETHLKVLLEEEYRALGRQQAAGLDDGAPATSPALGRQQAAGPGKIKTDSEETRAMRQIIIPALEKEVNEGTHFAPLRQIYHSLILANWYKKRMNDSILSRIYADQNKVAGVDIDDKVEAQKIYERYVQAFQKGAYNYIREEYDPDSQEMIPRKYFSGGMGFRASSNVVEIHQGISTGVTVFLRKIQDRLMSIVSVLNPATVSPVAADRTTVLNGILTLFKPEILAAQSHVREQLKLTGRVRDVGGKLGMMAQGFETFTDLAIFLITDELPADYFFGVLSSAQSGPRGEYFAVLRSLKEFGGKNDFMTYIVASDEEKNLIKSIAARAFALGIIDHERADKINQQLMTYAEFISRSEKDLALKKAAEAQEQIRLRNLKNQDEQKILDQLPNFTKRFIDEPAFGLTQAEKDLVNLASGEIAVALAGEVYHAPNDHDKYYALKPFFDRLQGQDDRFNDVIRKIKAGLSGNAELMKFYETQIAEVFAGYYFRYYHLPRSRGEAPVPDIKLEGEFDILPEKYDQWEHYAIFGAGLNGFVGITLYPKSLDLIVPQNSFFVSALTEYNRLTKNNHTKVVSADLQSQDFAQQIGRTFTTITLPQLYSSGYDAQERRKIIGNTAKVMEIGTDIKIAEVFPYTPAGKKQAQEAVESLASDLESSGFKGISRTFGRPIFFEFKDDAYLVYAHYILQKKGAVVHVDNNTPQTALGATDIVDPVGGIDLTADKTRLEIRGNGNSVRFNLDAESLKNIKLDGLEPVIVNVAPVKDIQILPNTNPVVRP